jgi:hypothetical protein
MRSRVCKKLIFDGIIFDDIIFDDIIFISNGSSVILTTTHYS